MRIERTAAEPASPDEGREPAVEEQVREPFSQEQGREVVTQNSGRAPVARDKSRGRLNMDVLVGYVLAGGVITSMILIAAGLIWHWAATGSLGLQYTMGGMNFFRFVVSDVATVIRTGLGPRRMINLGIAVLMLTPYVRVASSMVYFGVVERNWKYTFFTGFVLAVLTYSLFLR